MNREQAKELLQRYRMGLCTPEEEAAIGKWYDAMAATGEWMWTEEERRAFEEPLRAGILRAMNEPAILSEPVAGGAGLVWRNPGIVKAMRYRLSRVAAAAAILPVCPATRRTSSRRLNAPSK